MKLKLLFSILLLLAVKGEEYHDHNQDNQNKYVSSLIEHLNKQPNQVYIYQDGILLSAEKKDQNLYTVEANVKASNINEPRNYKLLKCHGAISNVDNTFTVVENTSDCQEEAFNKHATPEIFESGSLEDNTDSLQVAEENIPKIVVPVKDGVPSLSHEVQSSNQPSSGEQFVAVRREHPVDPCTGGCSTLVDVNADGVEDLALMTVRHIDRHEPNEKHTLEKVLEVERQIQAVSGIRYILKLKVNFDKCDDKNVEGCKETKTCKISVLEKPWIKLPNGSKFRAVVSNNCTKEYLFPDNPASTNDVITTDTGEKIVVKQDNFNTLQALPLPNRELTPEELKKLEEQIIPKESIMETNSEPEKDFPKINNNNLSDEKKSTVDFLNRFPIDKPQNSMEGDTANLRETTSVEKHQILGVEEEVDKTDPQFWDMVQETMRTLAKGTFDSYKIERIEKVTKKLVSGIIYKIYFLISTDEDNALCHVEVWQRPWLMNSTVMDKFECNLSANSNRNAPKEVDKSNIKYQKFIENALVSESGSIYKDHKLESIDKVTRQTISGYLYKISFTISNVDNFKQSCVLEVWEKPWLHSVTVSSFNCQPNRAKRSIFQNVSVYSTEHEVDPNSLKYLRLVKEVLTKDVAYKDYTVSTIDRVKWKIAFGSLYKINFTVSNVSGDKLVCYVEIYDKGKRLPKESSHLSCNHSRKRRHLIGGNIEQDINNPEFLTKLKKALKSETAGIYQSSSIKSIDKVVTQVVAGSLTKINFTIASEDVNVPCYVEIWERPWLDSFIVTTFSCTENDNLKSEQHDNSLIRSKRQLPGGNTQQDKSDPKYFQKLENALKSETAGTYQSARIKSIDNVVTQVVQGSLTKINFTIAFEEGNIPCYTEIWERPWLNSFLVTTFSCVENKKLINKQHNKKILRSKRQLVGGNSQQDKSDPKYFQKLENALKSETAGTYQSARIKSIDNVVTQVVQGSLTKINFTIAFEEGNIPCYTEIWERPWLNSFLVTTFSCVENKKLINKQHNKKILRSKRQLVGGNSQQDKSDPKYFQKLENALKSETAGTFQSARIKSIDNVVTQVVQGSLTKINFTVASEKGNIPCYTEIWERPWLNSFIVTTFTCSEEHRSRRNIQDALKERTLTKSNFNNVEINEYLYSEHKHFIHKALIYIESKYPHPNKQKVIKVLSASIKHKSQGIYYKAKLKVGITDCLSLKLSKDCKLDSNKDLIRLCSVQYEVINETMKVHCNIESNLNKNIYLMKQANVLFNDFLRTYPRSYANNSQELGIRFQIFKNNILKMHSMNMMESGTATYGITKFADLTYGEFAKKYTGLRPDLKMQDKIRKMAAIPKIENLPSAFDWRDKGAVTEVKNQGMCGSCWAFSVTGNVEGQWKIKTGELISLSEQELVDCDKLDDGCNGGMPDNAYRAIESLGGLESETDYPYQGDNEECHFNKSLTKVKIANAVNITTNETDMAKWLVQNGPIAIGINANAMQFYLGGISHPWKFLCNPTNLDHGVLIVGYGVKHYTLFNKTLPYWTIKNSWGVSWGEQGYYRVYRGDGTCGVNQMASSAVIS